MATTDIEIIYHFPDGRRESLGTGTIDETGVIDITSPRAGQEDYIKKEMDELNARDYVVLKEPPAPGQSRYSINKRKVYRRDAEFLSALKDYGMRVYAMEFVFDAYVLGGDPSIGEDDIASPARGAVSPVFADDADG